MTLSFFKVLSIHFTPNIHAIIVKNKFFIFPHTESSLLLIYSFQDLISQFAIDSQKNGIQDNLS
jgi:hypothetical protein